jgi:hypothetical protein
MGDESLYMLFKKLGKELTKDNAHVMCALACATPEIFYAPAMGPYALFMRTDIANVYCKTREISMWSSYSKLARNVLAEYGIEEYKNADTLKAIFEELDKKIAQIRKLLSDDNFPPLD